MTSSYSPPLRPTSPFEQAPHGCRAADLARQLDAKRSGAGWMATCPAHEDHTASLSIGEGEDGRLLLKCHAGCEFADILKAAGVQPTRPNGHAREHASRKAKIVATYDYRDPRGDRVFQVVRYEPKNFKQRRPDGKGGWLWNLQGIELVPYRLPEIINASEVCICEGEKDADSLARLGLAATTCPMGAGKWPAKIFNGWFDGRHVVLLPHHDEPGRKHARDVAGKLQAVAASIKIVDLPSPPRKGYDVSDWLDDGHGAEELARLVDASPYWEPGGEGDAPSPGGIVAITSTALLQMEMPPRTVLMSPWIAAQSIAMVFAHRGTGKTFFLMSAALALASGSPFLGWQVPRPVRVAYVEGELPGFMLKERFKLLGTDDNLTVVNPELQPDMFLPHLAAEETQQAFASIIEAHDVLILDSLATLAPCSFDRDSETWAHLQPWFLAIRRRGKALVFAHHTNRGGSQRGVSAREDVLDFIIKLEDVSEDRSCHFAVTYEKTRQFEPGADPGKLFQPFEARLEGAEWTTKAEDLGQLMTVADLTLEGKPIRKISDITGLPKTTVNRLQKQARARGIL